MWYRIFGSRAEMPAPAAILELLASRFKSTSGQFAADETGWYQADLKVDGIDLQLERYRADEPGIRAELNSWAAWLETREDVPEHAALMERMIQTAQLFTLQSSTATPRIESVCLALCRFLAENTAGVYQVDGQGLFAADGRLLVAE
jgi:hypothetical protein